MVSGDFSATGPLGGDLSALGPLGGDLPGGEGLAGGAGGWSPGLAPLVEDSMASAGLFDPKDIMKQGCFCRKQMCFYIPNKTRF